VRQLKEVEVQLTAILGGKGLTEAEAEKLSGLVDAVNLFPGFHLIPSSSPKKGLPA